MVNWDRRKEKNNSHQIEVDVSKIDQSVFDDPILLLDYLEKTENERKGAKIKAINKKTKELESNKEIIHNKFTNKVVSKTAFFGYDIIHDEIRIDNVEAEAIKAIFSLFNNGYGYKQIASALLCTNHRTPNGRVFQPEDVQIVIEKRNIYDGSTGYPPIINKKDSSKAKYKYEIHSQISHVSDLIKSKEKDVSMNHEKLIPDKINSEERPGEFFNQGNRTTYKTVDDFLPGLKEMSAVIVDNRCKDGCVWVKSDPVIDPIVSKVIIKERHFKFAQKSKALNGAAGWYF